MDWVIINLMRIERQRGEPGSEDITITRKAENAVADLLAYYKLVGIDQTTIKIMKERLSGASQGTSEDRENVLTAAEGANEARETVLLQSSRIGKEKAFDNYLADKNRLPRDPRSEGPQERESGQVVFDRRLPIVRRFRQSRRRFK